jgi:hypothetical protein
LVVIFVKTIRSLLMRDSAPSAMNAKAGESVQASGRRVDELLAHYGLSHQNPVNERIHFIAIALIMLSLLGLLYALHPWAAYAFVAASLVFFLKLGVSWSGTGTDRPRRSLKFSAPALYFCWTSPI